MDFDDDADAIAFGGGADRTCSHRRDEARPESPFTRTLHPALAFLARGEKPGIALERLEAVERRAERLALDPVRVLLCSGLIGERDYYRRLARDRGLAFREPISGKAPDYFRHPDPQDWDARRRLLRREEVRDRVDFLAPGGPSIVLLDSCLKVADPLPGSHVNETLAVSTPSANEAVILERSRSSLMRQAVEGLEKAAPAMSARTTVMPRQAVALLLAIQLIGFVAFLSTELVVLAAHLVASSFYLACVVLRVLAFADFDARRRSLPSEPNVDRQFDDTLPVYSVIVPLYREANQVDALLLSLLRLDWPREKLDIILACESDDGETLEALNAGLARRPGAPVRVVAVPPAHPRTKPKALNYVLPLCRGEYVVIYDAEDRPHPLQLREAYGRFRTGSPKLACLQAPLAIHNHGEGFWPRLFAIEYSALFDGLLPYLARIGSVLPLGGTSNHFPIHRLRAAGGWDGHNVTEDADLGIRLARMGWSIGVLRCPTWEEAPQSLRVWLPQRTRWFKGWYQTWLVHMRHPMRTARDLGLRGTVLFHVIVTGMVVSALVHPLLLWFVAAKSVRLMDAGWGVVVSEPLIALDVVTLGLGYLAFGALAWKTLALREMKNLRRSLWLLPLYWLAISFAAWRGLLHLWLRPHAWDKTQHTFRPLQGVFVEEGRIAGPDAYDSGGRIVGAQP